MADVLSNAEVRFRTARLRLEPRTLADTEDCLAMDREPGVTRFVNGPWDDPAAHRTFVEARTRGPYPGGMGYWTIRPLADGGFAGWVLLIPADGTGPQIEVGWRLRRRYWGQGFATEAMRPVLAHAFGTLGLDEVVADIDARNAASLGVARKLGMRFCTALPEDAGVATRYAVRADAWGGAL